MTTLTYAMSDSMTMLRRNFRHMLRYPVVTFLVVGIPVILLLMFVYVFGGTLGDVQAVQKHQPGSHVHDRFHGVGIHCRRTGHEIRNPLPKENQNTKTQRKLSSAKPQLRLGVGIGCAATKRVAICRTGIGAGRQIVGMILHRPIVTRAPTPR